MLNRSWESALTPTLLMHTPTAPKPPVGILLDPPYLTIDRQSELYGSDADGSSSDVATAAYQWALANGERFRIAYCCREGDFLVPDGWSFITASFGVVSGRGAAGIAAGYGDVFAAVCTRRTRPADAIAMIPVSEMGRYATVVIDPPWPLGPMGWARSLGNRLTQASDQYSVMGLDGIAAVPVADVLADDALVF